MTLLGDMSGDTTDTATEAGLTGLADVSLRGRVADVVPVLLEAAR